MIHEASAAERLGMVKLTTSEGYRWMKVDHILGIERSKLEDFTIIKMLIGEASMAPITVQETPEEVLSLMTDVIDAQHVETHEELLTRARLSIQHSLATQAAAKEAYAEVGMLYDPLAEAGGPTEATIKEATLVNLQQSEIGTRGQKAAYDEYGLPYSTEQREPFMVFELPQPLTDAEKQAAADAWLRANGSGSADPDAEGDE